MGYNFKSRSVAVDLNNFAVEKLGSNGVAERTGSRDAVILVKTPLTPDVGCDPNEAVTGGEAFEYKVNYVECDVVSLYGYDTDGFRELTDEIRTCPVATASDLSAAQAAGEPWIEHASETIEVYNPHDINIEGGEFYFAAWIGGEYCFICHGSVFRLAQTPSGGIPGRSGTTLGSASCSMYYIAKSGTTATLTADTRSETIYNMSTSAVAGTAYIQAVRINGFLVANWEDCN